MNSSWHKTRLGEVSRNWDSKRIPVKRADRRPGPYPYYGASGIVDCVDDFLFDGEYLLVAEDGENLNSNSSPIAFLASGRFWVNNHAHVLQGNSEALTPYLLYWLRYIDLRGFITGSAQPKLSQANLNRVPVVLPPLEEQARIVGILRALDDKIELNREMNSTLEETAQALFRSWFVDFDPVVARADGQQPFGMSEEMASLFPDHFEDSVLGPIPAGWSVGEMQDVTSLHREQLTPKDCPEEMFAHYSIPAWDDAQWPALETGSQIGSSKYQVPTGAVLVSKLNPSIPRVWLPEPELPQRAVCSTEFLVCQPRSVTAPFLYCLFRDDGIRAELCGLVTGTSNSHQRVRPSDFLRLRLTVPSAPVAEAFDHSTHSLIQMLIANRHESRTLAGLRDLLLPKLLSGEIRLRQAEEIVEVAL